MNDYDVSSIFQEMENYLLSSMSRNMKRHTNWENEEGFQWEMWQTKQLDSLNDYRKQNKKYIGKQSSLIQLKIEELLKQSNEHGAMQQEIKILEAIKKGFKPGRVPKGVKQSFFKLNDRKLNALIKSTNGDMQKGSTAMLRMVNDEYRKTIFKAQMFANTGTMTTDQAIDMATKDFLSKGINCIEYSNGNRVNIASYAEMAIKTANQRAYFEGEGSKRAEWGVHTVLISSYGSCSQTCLPYQGKVYVDDVWSGGTAKESEELGFPLLSTAIDGGLFHPNCKHTMTTYFEGITEIPSKADVAQTSENSDLISTQRYNERMIRKYKRLEIGSLDEQNKAKYKTKVKEWQGKQRQLISNHPEMHRNYKRESLQSVTNVDSFDNNIIKKGQGADKLLKENSVSKLIYEDEIHFNDKKQMNELLYGFKEQYSNQEVEYGMLLSPKNKAFVVKGTKSTNDFSMLSDDVFENSFVIHNHPNQKTHYSFSSADVSFFLENKIAETNAFDHKYEYKIKRTKDTLEKGLDSNEFQNTFFDIIDENSMKNENFVAINDEDEYHVVIDRLAKKYKFLYERRLRK